MATPSERLSEKVQRPSPDQKEDLQQQSSPERPPAPTQDRNRPAYSTAPQGPPRQKSAPRVNGAQGATSLTRQLIPPPEEDTEANTNQRPDYSNKFLQGIFSMDPNEVKE